MTVNEVLANNSTETIVTVLLAIGIPWFLLFLDLGDVLRDHLRRQRMRTERIRRGELPPD